MSNSLIDYVKSKRVDLNKTFFQKTKTVDLNKTFFQKTKKLFRKEKEIVNTEDIFDLQLTSFSNEWEMKNCKY